MSLPIFHTDNKDMMLMQTKWKSELDPVLKLPILDGVQLTNVKLINGTTIVNHFLGRKQQGWIVTDVNGAATIYRSQPFNETNLVLTSNAAVTVNIWCY